MRIKVYELPNKLLIEWDEESRAMIDTFYDYNFDLEEAKAAVLGSIPFAHEKKAIAWIVDSANSKGSFSAEIQYYIAHTVLPKLVEIGIHYFMTINAKDAITRLTINDYTSKAGTLGLKTISGGSVSGAIEWLKKNSNSI